MSIKVTSYVWEHSKQRGTKLLMLLAIADNANDQGEAFPKIETLARKTKMTKRNAQMVIQKLESEGDLVVQERENTSNLYIIPVPWRADAPQRKRKPHPLRGVKKPSSVGMNDSSSLTHEETFIPPHEETFISGVKPDSSEGVKVSSHELSTSEPSLEPREILSLPRADEQTADSDASGHANDSPTPDSSSPGSAPPPSRDDGEGGDAPTEDDILRGLGMGAPTRRYGGKASQARQHPLVIAFRAAFPDSYRPPVDDTFLDIAERMAAAGYTAEDVRALTSKKVGEGKVDYPLLWCERDMPGYLARKNLAAAPPSATPSVVPPSDSRLDALRRDIYATLPSEPPPDYQPGKPDSERDAGWTMSGRRARAKRLAEQQIHQEGV